MKFEYTTRLAGSKEEYHTLSIWKEGQKYPIVHTNKKLSELRRIEKRIKTEKKLLQG